MLRAHSGAGAPAGAGTGALLATLADTPGGLGYADLPDVARSAYIKPLVADPSGVYQRPADGLNANCSLDFATLPGGGDPSAAVGGDPYDDWSLDGLLAHGDITYAPRYYPICGMTFMLVYARALPDDPWAIRRMSDNERRTLFTYVGYMLSSIGQSRLRNIYYMPIPEAWREPILEGVEQAY